MIDSRSLSDLHPAVRRMAEEFLAKCKAAGIAILIYSTYRDKEKQDALYAQGRTKTGDIVTRARGGDSMHNYRLAFDFVPMIGKFAAWNDDSLYAKAGTIAESCGLEWAGRWTGRLREKAHCQYLGGLTLDDLKAGKLPKE